MFKFLVIFIGVIYLLGYLGRFFLGRWLKNVQSNTSSQQRQAPQKPEGDISINKQSNNTKKAFQKDDGDYVDYEEVK